MSRLATAGSKQGEAVGDPKGSCRPYAFVCFDPSYRISVLCIMRDFERMFSVSFPPEARNNSLSLETHIFPSSISSKGEDEGPGRRLWASCWNLFLLIWAKEFLPDEENGDRFRDPMSPPLAP